MRKKRKQISTTKADRQLRMRIFLAMGTAEISGAVLVENMDVVFDWIKSRKGRPRPQLKLAQVNAP